MYDSVTLGQIDYSKDIQRQRTQQMIFHQQNTESDSQKIGIQQTNMRFKQHTCGFSTNAHVLCTQTGDLLEDIPLGNYFL